MAYEKLDLSTGDTVTAAVFQHIEDGIYDADNAVSGAATKDEVSAVKKTADAAATKTSLNNVKKVADDAAKASHKHVAADITDLQAFVDARIAAAKDSGE